jgi:hypothetical protein
LRASGPSFRLFFSFIQTTNLGAINPSLFSSKGGKARTSPSFSQASNLNRRRIVEVRIGPLRGSFRGPRASTFSANFIRRSRFSLRRIKPHERMMSIAGSNVAAESNASVLAGCSADVHVRARSRKPEKTFFQVDSGQKTSRNRF